MQRNPMPTLWNLAIRLGISIGISALVSFFVAVQLPAAALVGIGQVVLYSTFCVIPLQLDGLLVRNLLQEKLSALSLGTIEIPKNGASRKSNITLPITYFWDTDVEKAAKVKFVNKLLDTRSRKINEFFYQNLIPVFTGPVLLILFSILQSKVTPAQMKTLGMEDYVYLFIFVQCVIGLLPLFWTFGNIYGEITTHRDTAHSVL